MDNTSFAPGNNSINNSVPPLTPQYSAPGPKHLPKLVTWVVLILALGLSAFAGIWYWQDQKIGDDYVAVFTPRPSTTPDPTADWKTYTNTQYGFEFKYPDNWSKSETSNGVTLTIYGPGEHNKNSGDFGNAARIVFLGFDKLTEEIKSSTTEQKTSKGIFSQNGFLGVVVFDTKKPELDWGSWIKAYTVASNGRVVQLDWLSANQFDSTDFTYEKYLLPILSTFKFTDSTAGKFCGGIAGIACPSGYTCKLDGSYPDAGGTCVKN